MHLKLEEGGGATASFVEVGTAPCEAWIQQWVQQWDQALQTHAAVLQQAAEVCQSVNVM